MFWPAWSQSYFNFHSNWAEWLAITIQWKSHYPIRVFERTVRLSFAVSVPWFLSYKWVHGFRVSDHKNTSNLPLWIYCGTIESDRTDQYLQKYPYELIFKRIFVCPFIKAEGSYEWGYESSNGILRKILLNTLCVQ